jgi:alpha-tubulin suppressor-like RCC1 family protein
VYEPQLPKQIAALANHKIVDVQCGHNHSLALDDEGAIFTWGCAGYGRLGLNETPPRDVMIPKEVSGFKNRNNFVKKIAVGPTCGMVTDSRDTLYLWGKWKNSGDGGQGTPWLYPKYFDGLSGWKIDAIACGGVSLFALSEKCTISWGQNAQNGELGHGAGKPRSATNAVKVDALEGMNVFQVSCGLGHTLLLVDPKDPGLATLEKSAAVSGEEESAGTGKRKAEGAKTGASKKTKAAAKK